MFLLSLIVNFPSGSWSATSTLTGYCQGSTDRAIVTGSRCVQAFPKEYFNLADAACKNHSASIGAAQGHLYHPGSLAELEVLGTLSEVADPSPGGVNGWIGVKGKANNTWHYFSDGTFRSQVPASFPFGWEDMYTDSGEPEIDCIEVEAVGGTTKVYNRDCDGKGRNYFCEFAWEPPVTTPEPKLLKKPFNLYRLASQSQMPTPNPLNTISSFSAVQVGQCLVECELYYACVGVSFHRTGSTCHLNRYRLAQANGVTTINDTKTLKTFEETLHAV